MAIGTQIPSRIVLKLTTLMSKQLTSISGLVSKMSLDSLNLSASASCSDPNVKKLKNDLRKFQNELTRLNSIIENVNRIIPVIQNITNIASASRISQLLIPAVQGVPAGPVTVLINLFTKLVENSNSAIISIQNILNNANAQLSQINNTMANVLNIIGGICNSETFETSAEIAEIIQQTPEDYPSEFYTELNVSDDDINDRFNVITSLLENQIDVITNLIEAPSQVITGTGVPSVDLGKIDDYYIDTITNQIYGPKTTEGWNSSIN